MRFNECSESMKASSSADVDAVAVELREIRDNPQLAAERAAQEKSSRKSIFQLRISRKMWKQCLPSDESEISGN